MLFDSDIEKKVFPKQLWSDHVIGQERLLSQIHQSCVQGKLPHCSLVSGKAGAGQLYVALMMAQSLLCAEAEAPCGICESCHKVSELIHPDLHFALPVFAANQTSESIQVNWKDLVKSKPYLNIYQWQSAQDKDAKQANITAAECRYIIDRMYLKPFESDRNVLILWLPEYLGKEGNILLKLLEEPPGNSFLILVTEDASSIINTILSRAHLFKLKPIDDESFNQFFIGKYNINPELVLKENIVSEKNISIAYQNLVEKNHEVGEFKLELIRSFFQRILRNNPVEIVQWVDDFHSIGKDNQKIFFTQVLQVLSLSLGHKSRPNVQANHKIDLLDFTQKLSTVIDLKAIENIMRMIEDTMYYLQRNASVKIVMTDMMIQSSTFFKNKN